MIKRLEELERKVQAIVTENKDLREQVARYKKESSQFQEKVSSLEGVLLSETSAAAEVTEERDSLCSSIDSLLSNIDTLESEGTTGS
jgi:chromosome segregation ATPase